MDGLTIVIVLLFAIFLVGTILRILCMLERKRAGDDIDRARLVFFFTGCLMLVCLIPLIHERNDPTWLLWNWGTFLF